MQTKKEEKSNPLKTHEVPIYTPSQILQKVEKLKKQAETHFIQKDYENSIKKYEEALQYLHFKKQPNQKNILINQKLVIKILNNKTQCYLNLKQTEKALSNTLFILDVDPTNVQGYYRAGKALFEQGKIESSWNVLQLGLKYLVEGHAFRKIYCEFFQVVKGKMEKPKPIQEILKK